MEELTVEAQTENLPEVLSFLTRRLEELGCQPKVQRQIEIAAEEIFVNIAHYAYPQTEIPRAQASGSATVRFSVEEGTAVITFIDSGVPYNPLAKPDPDLTLPAQKRPIGGLGIYMVKKSMDEMSYDYRDGQNILTIKKKIEAHGS